MNSIANVQTVQEVIARVWSDESLKARLMDNPKAVLANYGLEFPSSVEVQVHENTASLMNYVLPQASEIPEGVDLEEIEPVAGKVMKLALADEAFKAKLLSDPKAAIAEATNVSLPPSLEIRVYEDTPTVKHLVLPVNPATEELSDFELEAIAGGADKANEAKAGCGGATVGVAIGAGLATFIPGVGIGIATAVAGIGGLTAQGASAVAEGALE